jgi:hypothetical protein
MFLVGHSPKSRAYEVRAWLNTHPSVALLLAATYFEWTLYRAIIGLSIRPSVQIREALACVYGLDRYKDSWREEVLHVREYRRLPEVVSDWQAVTKAFDARNRLAHGRDRYTRNMATPHVDALITAVSEVMAFSLANGVDINRRLPVRRNTPRISPTASLIPEPGINTVITYTNPSRSSSVE